MPLGRNTLKESQKTSITYIQASPARRVRNECPTSVELPSGESVPMYSLRFVVNLPVSSKCRPNEGLITIESMRTWSPTAAHVLQMLTRFQAGK